MTSTPAAALPMDASGVARYGSCIPHEEASVTKSELIEAPADKSGSTRATAALVVDTIFDAIVAGLDAGAKVEVRNFGAFRVKSYDG